MTYRLAAAWWAIAVCALALSCAARAGAQASADDKAAAEALFDQGIAHMREGKLEQACVDLERSQSLERGIGTMLYLAECYEKLGRSASAWALFREAASVAAAQGEAERARVGSTRADRLAPTLSRLTLQVPAENRIDGFELLRNGQPIRAASWGVAVPVDPGEHALSAGAPGRVTWSQKVTVKAGERLEVQLPALPVDPNAPPPQPATPMVAPPPAEPAPPLAVSPTPPPPAASTWPVQRTVALVVGGVGVVGLGVGAFFGARAFSKSGDADDLAAADSSNCEGTRCGNMEIENLTEDAKDAATLSTVFMIGGAALAVTGVVLFVTAPSEESPQLAVRATPSDVRLTMGGAF